MATFDPSSLYTVCCRAGDGEGKRGFWHKEEITSESPLAQASHDGHRPGWHSLFRLPGASSHPGAVGRFQACAHVFLSVGLWSIALTEQEADASPCPPDQVTCLLSADGFISPLSPNSLLVSPVKTWRGAECRHRGVSQGNLPGAGGRSQLGSLGDLNGPT